MPLSDGREAFGWLNRTLAEAARLGVPLPRALSEIGSALRRGRLRESIGRVEAALREGRSLSRAVRDEAGAFPPYYAWMVEAGEASGDLPGALLAVARVADSIRKARRAIEAVFAYPVIVLVFAAAAVSYLLFAVRPRYEEIFRDAGAVLGPIEAPAGAFAVGAILGISAVSAALLWALFRRSPAAERMILRIPLVGPALRAVLVSRFLGVLRDLVERGVRLPESIRLALGASGSVSMLAAAVRLESLARDGAPAGDLIAGVGAVPDDIAARLKASDALGRLGEGIREAADFEEIRARAAMDVLVSVLQPSLLAFAGIAVGFAYASFAIPYARLLSALAGG